MINNEEIIEIKDSLLKTYEIGALCLTFPGFLTLFLFLSRFPEEFKTPQLIFTILFIFGLPVIVVIIIYLIKGMRNTAFIISNIKVECFVNNSLYLQLYWKDIKEIIIQKEKFTRPVSRYTLSITSSNSGYSLNFKGLNLNKVIKLWCFPLSIKKQNLIIEGIIKFSQKQNKELILEEKIEDSFRKNNFTCEEINNFIKLHRKRIRKKNSIIKE